MWGCGKTKAKKSFRLSKKALANLDAYAKQIEKTPAFALNNILEKLATEPQRLRHSEGENPPPETEKPFDYETWYSDCEFGTYFKEKKKVHCACSYPSLKRWLPKNRMIDPQICDNCFPRIQQIKEFIEKRQEEKKALAHTKPYFLNEYGQKIYY